MTLARSRGERPRTSASPWDESQPSECTRTPQSTYLLCHNNVEIMLGLIDMSTHGHDAAKARWICLRGAGRRRVHDGIFRGPQEIRRAS